MEKIYEKFEPVLNNSVISTGDTTINLTGVALAFLANGTILSLMNAMFGG